MTTRRVAQVLLLIVLWVPGGAAQQREEMVPRLYPVKWRTPEEIARLLDGFAPRVTASSIQTITVVASEKTHAAIAELIRTYDVPAKTIDFQFYLIKASVSGEGIKDGVPDKIRRVIGDIAALTRYRSFELLDSPAVRATEGRDVVLSGKGVYFYRLSISGRGTTVLADEKSRRIHVNDFEVGFSIPTYGVDGKPGFRDVGVRTSFDMQDGETLVVGASHIRDDPKETGSAIITVVTGKVVG
jgi:hypothetical protein